MPNYQKPHLQKFCRRLSPGSWKKGAEWGSAPSNVRCVGVLPAADAHRLTGKPNLIVVVGQVLNSHGTWNQCQAVIRNDLCGVVAMNGGNRDDNAAATYHVAALLKRYKVMSMA